MANSLPAVFKAEPKLAPPEAKQMPEVAIGEDMGTFLARCVVDEVMMSQHPNATDRRMACETLWADDQTGDAGDMADMTMNDGIVPPAHRAAPPPVVYFNDTTERKQRVGKPNSQIGADGRRHSVRLMP